jgi:hypothetical protein
MRTLALVVPALLLAALTGCGKDGDQPPFAELYPVKGIIKRGGEPVNGGAVRFYPDPDKPEFIVNSKVGADGTYSLTTVRTTDTKGERKSGAPAGNYKVVFHPDSTDQTSGGSVTPIPLVKPVAVNAGENDIPIDLPAKK